MGSRALPLPLHCTSHVSAPEVLRNNFSQVSGAARSRSGTDTTGDPCWPWNCPGKRSAYLQAFQEYQTPLTPPAARKPEPISLPSPGGAGSQLRCYQRVLPPQLKGIPGSGLWESKRRATGASPVPFVCVRACDCWRSAFLQEKPWLSPGAGIAAPACCY